jgi:hypothetical protein
MHSLHKSFEVIITDSAHMAECSISHFIHQTPLTNAPTKTRALQYIQSYKHYNTYDPIYSLHNTQKS